MTDITRLANIEQAGANAKVRLKQMEPTFASLQQQYYRAVVVNTQAAGEVDAHTVYKMIALEDLIQELKTEASRGAAAGKKLQAELKKHAGGSD